jgi:hypothetical protein
MLSHSLTDGAQLSGSPRNLQSTRENGKRLISSTHLGPENNIGSPHSWRNLSFSVTAHTDSAALTGYSDALDELARSSSEPNIFYEPWMLLPSLRAFGQESSFAFVLIFCQQAGRPPLLCGFFPLEITKRYRGIPVRAARLWTYLHFYWAAPLIREGCEHQCLQALFEWTRSEQSPCSLIEFGSMPAEGPMARALIDVVDELKLQRYVRELYTRALLRRACDAETCIRRALPGRRLKELNRVRRRLAEKGTLTVEELTPEGNLSEWLEGFLALEARGWKGEAGTALASAEGKRQFFLESARAAFARGQLMMMRLRLNGSAIAYKCNFLSGPGAFAFKIAYDEQYSSYSPGVHLELENVRCFHAMPGMEWMDSCADPDHFMANHLWGDSRAIQSTAVAVRGRLNGLLLAAFPLLKWAKHSLRPAAPLAESKNTTEIKDTV